MEGRGDGAKGLTRAAHVIEQRYKSLGLEPAGRTVSSALRRYHRRRLIDPQEAPQSKTPVSIGITSS